LNLCRAAIEAMRLIPMEGWILTPEVGLWLALDGCPAAGRKGIAWIAAISELVFTSRYSSFLMLDYVSFFCFFCGLYRARRAV
jgi:hypothetical protein